MTTLYDSVTARDIPADATDVAGYVTGRYAWSAADWARFTHATRKVEIATQASFNTGDVLDVEKGDATPDQAPGWIRARKASGYYRPTIYCEASAKAAVVAACYHQSLVLHADYDLWIAHYTGHPHDEPDAAATQYADPVTSGGHYDLSSVADPDWPHRTPPQENDMTPDESNKLTDIWNMTTNLQNVSGQFIQPILNQIKADVENPNTGGGAGQISAADIDRIAKAELDAMAARLQS